MAMLKMWRVLGGIALLALLAVPVAAQETTGVITGLVTDQSGAVLPGATVGVKRVDTGRKTEVVTNQDGRYLATQLDPGNYEVTFSMTGFNPIAVKGIALHVNDRLEVPGKLGVGGVTESVQVNAATQFVQPSP